MTPTSADEYQSPGEGYTFLEVAPCNGATCRRPIAWWLTPKQKRSPHDPDGTSHFATCPDAARFRRHKDYEP